MTESVFKRAALRLACLHPADRRWVLRRLPAAERQRLTTLLKELDQLGVEDPGVLLAALAAEEAAVLEKAAMAQDLRHEVLDALPPAWTMAALSLAAPAAQKTYLARFPEARRKPLTAQSPGTLPPLLASALRQRLKDAPTKPEASGA